MRVSMRDQGSRTPILRMALCLALIMFSGVASAQGLLKDQAKCLNAANANAAKIVKAQGKDICSCIKNGAMMKLNGTIEDDEACDTGSNALDPSDDVFPEGLTGNTLVLFVQASFA